MIIEHKNIEIFGKKVFEKVIVSKALKNPNPLPNEGCFFFVIEGTNQSISETQNITLQANDGVLMKCGNYIYKGKPDNSSQRLAFIAIHLIPDIIKKVYSEDASSILEFDSRPYINHNMAAVRNNPFVANYMEGLMLYFKYPNMVNEALMGLKYREFISLMIHTETTAEVRHIIRNLFNTNEFTFKEVIKAHLFSDLTAKDLAALTNNSLATFKRKFKEYYRDSPAHFIMKKRLEKSAEALIYSDESISKIAYDCQFKNAAHFSTAFKKVYTMAPLEFRKIHMQK